MSASTRLGRAAANSPGRFTRAVFLTGSAVPKRPMREAPCLNFAYGQLGYDCFGTAAGTLQCLRQAVRRPVSPHG